MKKNLCSTCAKKKTGNFFLDLFVCKNKEPDVICCDNYVYDHKGLCDYPDFGCCKYRNFEACKLGNKHFYEKCPAHKKASEEFNKYIAPEIEEEKYQQLKDKVRVKKCLYCKAPLTDKEINRGLKPFMKSIDFHLKLKGQIVLWCDKCQEKIEKGELKPLGSEIQYYD